MSKLNLLTGTLLKEIIESPINGEITVIKSVAFGTYLSVGNLTQSGGILQEIWKKTLRKIRNYKLPARNTTRSVAGGEISNCLILGLGGGSVAKVIRKYWPVAKITGVDIDPKMVEMGKKYLGLGELGVKVVISDAEKFLATKSKFDLICIDLYLGDKYPDKFEKEQFIKLVKKTLSPKGIAVFNRLYYGEKRKEAALFGEKLKKHFYKVDWFFPEANLMLICRS
ncbi:MAG: hypothetical protein US62_C0001G0027 [Candidatus Woesebacteria bacterium GW2011_GWA1_37_8]|uniref:PABS domain-containing protein n=2 Tax=Candidatus Woeseibacteriota TaxID=1752722 RepID=A0A0G0L6X9_9BACT|nr:MAG: hypothetical protein US62_C0001G0027 [Candidatus Woesebacteria bacterium GW2011_GWA1_37_8]KKQ87788.1 MAG: hypothetical protein UT10_C0001G0029 [Candidatus Woesebacteria bacterium GW2011_GWB1_38_8b]